MNVISKIQKQINENPILIYMKGSPEFPSCGFSAKAVNFLSFFKVRFAYIDVLKHPEIRRELPIFSNWPTFPQLWISGKLIGGSDIIEDLFHSGKLKKIIKKCLLKNKIQNTI
ncbi:Grx4 family monothiol glutaredoxin [Buchnera aphidicola]|uniref:Grx4 family monothiol glutaredoxin n=1 Tax=Buchnera aphidicola TaxID=9 RepID=UPI002092ED38|nr:Grx4 family monothiol glutaredoxin [Buchnera aphidicola]USS94261.1 Grx4 family monothiol glutaredoxin [Buchnera aphidicola (Sipha maydis)]WII23811.1 Grx4 family monothiol glutaredoxin [Buchnera aphidicola (Sipha maydis)]